MSDINDDPATTTPASLPVTDSTAQPTSNDDNTDSVTNRDTPNDTANTPAPQNVVTSQIVTRPVGAIKDQPNAVCHSDTQEQHGTDECVNLIHPMATVGNELPVTAKPAEMGLVTRRKPIHPQVYNPDRHCGAKSRSNNMEPCRRPKGWGTSHPLEGRCKLHGGSSALKAGGRYSTVMRPTLRAAIEKHDADPRPMDLIPEVSLLRALVEDYVGRYDMIRDALLAWHMAIQQGSSTPVIPARLPDITEAGRLIERVARVADTVHRIATEGSVSLACHQRMQEVMGMEVARIISTKTGLSGDDVKRVLDEIEKAWREIRIDSNRRPT